MKALTGDGVAPGKLLPPSGAKGQEEEELQSPARVVRGERLPPHRSCGLRKRKSGSAKRALPGGSQWGLNTDLALPHSILASV